MLHLDQVYVQDSLIQDDVVPYLQSQHLSNYFSLNYLSKPWFSILFFFQRDRKRHLLKVVIVWLPTQKLIEERLCPTFTLPFFFPFFSFLLGIIFHAPTYVLKTTNVLGLPKCNNIINCHMAKNYSFWFYFDLVYRSSYNIKSLFIEKYN